MTILTTATVTLPVSPDTLYAFLADLSKHRAFLEPAAMNFQGDADKHSYVVEVMGMKMPQELVAKTRTPRQLVTLVPGTQKMFDHELRFEIGSSDQGCSLRLVDEADIPMMMAMMGAEKLLQGQLDNALVRIQALAGSGELG